MNDGFSGLSELFRSTRFASLIRFMSGQTWKGRYYSMTIEDQYVRVIITSVEHLFILVACFFYSDQHCRLNGVSFTLRGNVWLIHTTKTNYMKHNPFSYYIVNASKKVKIKV